MEPPRTLLLAVTVLLSGCIVEPYDCYSDSDSDVVVKERSDLKRLEQVTAIDGDLIFCYGLTVSEVRADALVSVAGSIKANDIQLEVMSFPRLTSVGAAIVVGPHVIIESLQFPALVDVRGITLRGAVLEADFSQVERLDMLDIGGRADGLRFDNLIAVDESFDIHEPFGDVVLPKLEVAKAIHARVSYGTLSLPMLGEVPGGVALWFLVAQPELPSLISVGGLNLAVTSLDTISFPALVAAGNLVIEDNELLVDADFPALTSATHLAVQRNPALPSCWVDGLAERLGLAPNAVINADNNESGACE